MANNHLSYYDKEEIEAAVLDLLDMNMIEEAEYLAEQGLIMHPDDDSVEKLVIWIYLHHHKAEKAEEMFQKYREEGSEWSLRMKFAFCVMHGHPQKALADFLCILQEKKLPSLDWISTIDEMYEALPLKVLSPILIQAVKYIDDNAEALGRIGAMLIDAHMFTDASAALEKALDLDAYDIYSWQDLARCYLLTQENEKCIEACDFGLTIDEKNPLLSFIKGYLHYEHQEFAECIPYLQNARRFAEGKIEARNLNMSDDEIQQQINVTYDMLATAFMQIEKADSAQECYEILIERNPEYVTPYVQLTSIHLYKGDMNKALEYLNKAIELEPKSESVRSLQVSVLTTMKDFKGALDALKKLMQMKPKNHNFIMAYAELSRHLGLDKDADKAYRKLLKLGGLDKTCKDLLRNYFESIGDDEAVKQIED